MKSIIVIPARLASTRLPNKMLRDVCGIPLVCQTLKSALEADVAPVLVASDSVEIAQAIKSHGGECVITDPNLPAGTDRVQAAISMFDSNKDYDIVVNLQGDLPFIEKEFLQKAVMLAKNSEVDIATLATLIDDHSYNTNSVVKPVISFYDHAHTVGRALYFSRSPIPYNGPYYNHVGIYAFKRNSLDKFVKFPKSNLEQIESLEQLRALENGFRIDIAVVNCKTPISVDTAQDLEKAIKFANAIK